MRGVMEVHVSGESVPIKEEYVNAIADVIDAYFVRRSKEIFADGIFRDGLTNNGVMHRFMFPPHHIDHIHWDIFPA